MMPAFVKCDNCNSSYADVLGQDFDHDGKTYHFCMNCLVVERHRRKADMILNAAMSGVTRGEVTNDGVRVIEKTATPEDEIHRQVEDIKEINRLLDVANKPKDE